MCGRRELKIGGGVVEEMDDGEESWMKGGGKSMRSYRDKFEL